VWDDPTGGVPEDDVSQFQCLGLSRVLCTDNLARPGCEEKSCNEKVDRVVDGTCVGWSV
jgi:hypothetical protein